MHAKRVAAAVALLLLVSLAPTVVALEAEEPPRAGSSTAQAEAYTFFLRGRLALSGGDYAGAIDEFEKAALRDPTSTVIHTELAEVHLRLRHHRDAAREAERALAIDADNLDALQLAARAYEALGEAEKALAAHRRLVDADPGDPSHLVQLASILDRAGRSEEAIEVLERAIAREPGASSAVFELVERYRGLGRLDRALEVLEKAANGDPANVYLKSKLAELYIQLRKPQQAMVTLGAMVDLQPDNVDVLMEVGNSVRALELYPQAARLFARALELSGGDDGIRLQLAATLASMGALRNARDEYEKLLVSRSRPGVILSNEEHFALLKRIGWLSSELGDAAAARDALEKARPMAPADDTDFVRLLARAYDSLGQPAKSLALFAAAAKGHPQGDRNWTDIHCGHAAYEVITGALKSGVAHYEKLLELGVLVARHHGFFAHALLRRGDEGQQLAEQVMRRAVESSPNDEEQIYANVASLLLEVGASEQAFALVESVLRRIPDRDLFLFLAARYGDHESPERALTTLERAVAEFPGDAHLHFQLGAAYDRAKRPIDSDRALEAAIAIEPKHSGALNYLSYSWADRGVELEKALAYALRAVEIEPTNGAFLDTLGWVYFRLGRLEDAKSRLGDALKQVDDPVIRAHFGDVLSKLGDHAAALVEYETAATMNGADDVVDLQQKIASARSLAGSMVPAPAPSPTPVP